MPLLTLETLESSHKDTDLRRDGVQHEPTFSQKVTMIHNSAEYGWKWWGVPISGQLKLRRQLAMGQTCHKQRQFTIMQQHHKLFPEEERHDGYHENMDTNRGGTVQKGGAGLHCRSHSPEHPHVVGNRNR